MERNRKSSLIQEMIAVALIGGLLVGLAVFLQPSITGYVFVENYQNQLNLQLTESSFYELQPSDDFQLSSLRITGKAQGGLVTVYFIDDQQQRYLVYTNQQKPSENLITGLAIADTELTAPQLTVRKAGQAANAQQVQNYIDTSFSNACVDTCVLGMMLKKGNTYKLEINLAPQASLFIDSLTYEVASE